MMSGTILLERTNGVLSKLDAIVMPDLPHQLGPLTLEEMRRIAELEEIARQSDKAVERPAITKVDPSPVDLRDLAIASAAYSVDVACQVIALTAALLPRRLGSPIVKPLVRRLFPTPASR